MTKKGINNKNALIIKIALFLNFISKEDHSKLVRDLQKRPENTAPVDVGLSVHLKSPEFPSPNESAVSKTELDTTHMREIRETEFTLMVSNDGQNAFITKTDRFNDAILLEDLKFMLEQNGIIYGLVDDASLATFIKNPAYTVDFFKVAQGLEPVDGVDAQIVYMFERDYLKPGELSEDGTIDFKERGEIPFVSQGDLLAEKIPMKGGKDGVNVFGDAVPAKDALDINFSFGNGVRVSENGLTVLAETEGNPKVKPGGEISVNGAYYIEGDVDYTTGHIKFDKNVYISGSIKNGFRVEAIDIVSNTIDGGIVKAKGDVFINNGATESTIEAKGDIKAGFIHRSTVSCLGDMIVVKEIVDTQVLLEGKFSMVKGRMFSSHICAKGGARIHSIGSDRTGPSIITVGASLFLETELRKIDTAIDHNQNTLEQKTVEKKEDEANLTDINKKLNTLSRYRKQTIARIREIEEKIQKNAGQTPEENLQDKIDSLYKSIDEADKKIHDLNARNARIEIRLQKSQTDIEAYTEAVKTSVQEKFNLKRINRANPPQPILDVTGKIFSGTKISGRFATLILRENLTGSRIMEMSRAAGDTEAKRGWEMNISRL